MPDAKLTRAEVAVLLVEWNRRHDDIEAAFADLEKATGHITGSPLFEATWKCFTEYTAQLAARFDDAELDRYGHNWMTWYWLENDMGKKAMAAKAAHWPRARKVRRLDDLLDLLVPKAPAPKKGPRA